MWYAGAFDGAANEKVNVYYANCKDTATDASPCKSGWEAGAKLSYMVNTGQQLVVRMQDDGTYLDRLQKCAVFDKKNWDCTLENGSLSPTATFAMRDAKLDISNSWPSRVRTVAYWRWALLKYVKIDTL